MLYKRTINILANEYISVILLLRKIFLMHMVWSITNLDHIIPQVNFILTRSLVTRDIYQDYFPPGSRLLSQNFSIVSLTW